MSSLLLQLGLGSVGLLLVVVLAQGLLFVWRRRPLASYRLVVALVFAVLLLPLLQLGVKGWEHAGRIPFVPELARWRSELWSARPSARAPSTSAPAPSSRPAFVEEPLSPSELAFLAELVALERAPTQPRTVGEVPGGRDLSGAVLAGLVALYVAGLAIALFRTAGRLIRTGRLLRDSLPVVDEETCSVWNELARDSSMAARVRLLVSAEIAAPMCFGITRPAIVVPAAAEPPLEREVLRCVLLHELVHLERRDTWVMLAQELLRAVFWFHPAAWYLCKRADQLRELSCDLLVVERTGMRKRYAAALIDYATWMGTALRAPKPSTALLPWTTSKSQLSRRIEMLISLSSRRRLPWTSVPAAISLFSCIYGAQLALAAGFSQETAPEPRPEPEHAGLPEPVEPVGVLAPSEPLEPSPPWEPAPSASGGPRALPTPRLAQPPGAPFQAADPAPAPRPVPALEPAPWPVPFATRQEGGRRLIGVYLDDVENGILITSVMPGSLAQRQGLRAGDVIGRINGQPASQEELERAKSELGDGTMELTVYRRDGRESRAVDILLDGSDWPQPSSLGLPGGPAQTRSAEQFFDEALRAQVVQSTRDSEEEIRRARAALERALALDPDNDDLRSALSSLHTAQDRRAQAGDSLRAMLDRAAADQEADGRSRAWLELERGDFEAAREAYQRHSRGEAERARQHAIEAWQRAQDRGRYPEGQNLFDEARQEREPSLFRRNEPDQARRTAEERAREAYDQARSFYDQEASLLDREARIERTMKLLQERRRELDLLRRQLDELRQER